MSNNTGSIGSSNIYEDGDQRNKSQAEVQKEKSEQRFHEGQPHSHLANDSKDERSIANKLERESKREKEGDKKDFETQLLQKDATLPAKSHGNEPSKGAKIDQQLAEEEEEILKKKGAFGPK